MDSSKGWGCFGGSAITAAGYHIWLGNSVGMVRTLFKALDIGLTDHQNIYLVHLCQCYSFWRPASSPKIRFNVQLKANFGPWSGARTSADTRPQWLWGRRVMETKDEESFV